MMRMDEKKLLAEFERLGELSPLQRLKTIMRWRDFLVRYRYAKDIHDFQATKKLSDLINDIPIDKVKDADEPLCKIAYEVTLKITESIEPDFLTEREFAELAELIRSWCESVLITNFLKGDRA